MEYRQNTPYEEIIEDEGEQEESASHGNLGLPFGLCKKYGIALPDNATPRMAWDALKGKTGLTPEKVYRDLEQQENEKRDKAEQIYNSDGEIEETHLSEREKIFLQTLQKINIKYREIGKNTGELTTSEIINKVGGGDKTKGSCVSAAFAYVGNKLGFNVVDFRGGESQKFFSSSRNMKDILELDGINANFENNYDGYKSAHNNLKRVEPDKEYLFVAGIHCAIVRRQGNTFEYLELQSPTDNGFKKLNDYELKERFGVKHSRTVYGYKLECPSYLVEVENFRNSKAFTEVLGYINTAENEQQKGEGGEIK